MPRTSILIKLTGNGNVFTPWSSPNVLSRLSRYCRWSSDHFIHIGIFRIHTLILMAHPGSLLIIFIRKVPQCGWFPSGELLCLFLPFPYPIRRQHMATDPEKKSTALLTAFSWRSSYAFHPWPIPFSFCLLWQKWKTSQNTETLVPATAHENTKYLQMTTHSSENSVQSALCYCTGTHGSLKQ